MAMGQLTWEWVCFLVISPAKGGIRQENTPIPMLTDPLLQIHFLLNS